MWRTVIILYILYVCTVGETHGKVETKDESEGTEKRSGFPSSKSFQKQDLALLMTSAFPSKLMPKDSALRTIPQVYTTFVSTDEKNQITLGQFLNRYREEQDVRMEEAITETFKALLPLPKVLQCSFFTNSLLSTRIIWRWNDKNTEVNLKVQKTNSLHCVVDGEGTFQLSGGKHSKGTSKVSPGDCLYLPPEQSSKWYLKGRVIIVTMTWSAKHPSSQPCSETDKKFLADFSFRDDPFFDIFELFSLTTLSTFLEENHLSTNCTLEAFNGRFKKKHMKKLLQWNEESQAIANELFLQMDLNQDSKLSVEDLESLTPQEVRHLAGILEDRMADIKDIAEGQEEDKPKNKRGPESFAEDVSVNYEKEMQAILEEGFNEILREANVQGKVYFDKDGNPQVIKTSTEEPETEKEKTPALKEEL